ncbi:putative mediator complex subunit 20 [Tieghemostelium lacteum]|uniref:Mediator of RNA polymerase II transcription subunit 20 n=1 Tax=Tieghemostelium lacteum TaxID=361077 RepID=A0A151Z7B4_TIELA|nr:putative mediator complex subunit 20 [Tieghemostelium lacteum]|eukprot:KYQ89853.1 putative mediator complex subunit 20 [Tieghemostelium lacteum]
MVKRIEFLGGTKVSTWNIVCSLYLERLPNNTNQIPREFHLITLDERPKKCFMISHEAIVESDKEMISILEKTDSFRKRQVTEINGSKYELGDFIIRIGPIFFRTETKGIAIEVEYTPCSKTSTSPFSCTKLLSEFINGNLGPFPDQSVVQATFDFSAYPKLPNNYTDLHTSYQYLNLFKSI